jgi:hypothetical protein
MVFWAGRMFAVPTFFFVSGVLAQQSLARTRSARDFLRGRWHRLGIPLVAAAFTVLPLMYLIWAWGWVRFGWAAPEHVLHVHFGPAVQRHLHGFAHLWYLRDCLLCCALLACVRRLYTPSKPRVPRTPWWLLLHALFIGTLGAGIVTTLPDAVLKFPNSYLPAPGLFMFHALFFAWGVWLARSGTPSIPRALAVVCALAAVACALILPNLAFPAMLLAPNDLHPAHLDPRHRALVGLVACASGVSAILSLLACAPLMQASAIRAAVHFLAPRGLWIYLTHLVWMGLVFVMLYAAPIHVFVKAGTAFALGLAGPLITYPLFARVSRRFLK